METTYKNLNSKKKRQMSSSEWALAKFRPSFQNCKTSFYVVFLSYIITLFPIRKDIHPLIH